MARLTHMDASGAARMVDVSAKPYTCREATASGFIRLAAATLRLIQENGIAKGDVLAVARIAGIQAAKKTWELIPLCHQLPLSRVTLDFAFTSAGVRIEATATTTAQTGVEMEALTAVTVAALTIYDMCKAVDSSMLVEDVKLDFKTKSSVSSSKLAER